MDAVDAGFDDGPLAVLADLLLHLPPGLFHHLLNLGRMDTAVLDELFQGDAGNLPLHMVVAGKGNGLRGIVDNKVHTGKGLQGADVPALPADDTAFHFIAGQGHCRDGDLRHMVGGAALNGHGDNLPRPVVCLLLGPLLVLGDFQRLLMGKLPVQDGKKVRLRLLLRKTGDLLEFFVLAGLLQLRFLQALGGLRQLLLEGLLLLLHVLRLAVQVLFLLLDAALLALHLAAALLQLLLGIAFQLVNLVLGLQKGLFFLGFGSLDGVAHQALRFFLGGTKLCLCDFHSILNACKKGDNRSNNE